MTIIYHAEVVQGSEAEKYGRLTLVTRDIGRTAEQARNRRGARRWFIKGRVFESISEAARTFSVSEFTVWRWTFGAFDKRRNHFTPPRADCTAEERYIT